VKAVIPVASQRYAQERIFKVNADREALGKELFEDEKPFPEPPKKRWDNTSGKELARRKREKTHTGVFLGD
jgi:hypothetical protein